MHSPFRAPIPVETLLLAYRSGIFPMADRRDDLDIFWVEPRDRAILPLDGLHVSKSMRKVLRRDSFAVTVNRCFEDVVRACSEPRPGHPETWISERIVQSYCGLHRAGHAHSIEIWSTGDGAPALVGGLYGVAFDRVFCGESMFSRADNASKVALCWLVGLMRQAGYALLDCQFMTDHLSSMGAIEITQAQYMKRVAAARGEPRSSLGAAWRHFSGEDQPASDAGAGASVGAGSDGASPPSSPGKRIAQSLTQTS